MESLRWTQFCPKIAQIYPDLKADVSSAGPVSQEQLPVARAVEALNQVWQTQKNWSLGLCL